MFLRRLLKLLQNHGTILEKISLLKYGFEELDKGVQKLGLLNFGAPDVGSTSETVTDESFRTERRFGG